MESKDLANADFVTVGTELLALGEVVFELSTRLDSLSTIFLEVVHHKKMIEVTDIDRRMEELEEKYDGLLAHVVNNLPIINQIENFLKQGEGNKRGRY